VHIEELDIPDIKRLTPARHGDDRGFFSEIYNRATLAAHGIHLEFVQENFSLSADQGTVRGLHFQTPPFAQDKLVQVVSGAILDVAVDLRRGSPWFGQHVVAELSADNWHQLLVPVGFAHGFCTLQPDTAVIYHVTEHYSPAHDMGVLWNDPDLGIEWPVAAASAVLSDKDQVQPRLRDCATLFDYADAAG
jgi:dTDP-4-dehydrorhamnose 3,5-epimerase